MHYQRKTTKLATEQSKASNNLFKALLSSAVPTIYHATGSVRGNWKIVGATEYFVTSLLFIGWWWQRPWWWLVRHLPA